MAEDRAANEGTQWLPDEASVVALVRQRGGGAWAAGVAVGLADIVGRRRGRTFLANTETGSSELDGLMEADGQPGLTQALAGELAVSKIARSAPQRSFAYLPAGSPALSLSQIREVPAFRALVRRVAERGGTLLLYLAEEALAELPPDPDYDLPVDGCIAIGDIDDLALLVGAPLLARVERPAGDSVREALSAAGGLDGGPVDPEEGDAFPAADPTPTVRDRRVPAWAPWAGVAAGLLLAWLAWGSFSGPEADSTSDPSAAVAEADPMQAGASGGREQEGPGSSGETRGSPTPAEVAGEARGGEGPASMADAAFAGPELSYSVLVASFARPEDAARHLRQLDEGDAMFMVAPTPIRDRLYYRVLAGAREDRADAEALMQELVDAGAKEEVRGWDVRPVRFAWLLGTYAERRDADRRIGELETAGIRAYRLADASPEPRSWRVYAGAWESEQAAEEFGRMLREAGETGTLVTRRGKPR
jgi:cell division septation protein DedD